MQAEVFMCLGERYDDAMTSSEFGTVLKSLVSAKGWSVREFSRQAGRNPSFVSQVMRGMRKPPLHQIDKWTVILEVTGEEKDSFCELADLAHCPERIQKLIPTLRQKINDLISEQNKKVASKKRAKK